MCPAADMNRGNGEEPRPLNKTPALCFDCRCFFCSHQVVLSRGRRQLREPGRPPLPALGFSPGRRHLRGQAESGQAHHRSRASGGQCNGTVPPRILNWTHKRAFGFRCLYRGQVTNNKHATSGYVFEIKGIKTTWLSLGKHHSSRPTIPNVPLTWTLWLFGLRSSVVLIIIALCWYLPLTPWPLVDRTVYDTLWRETWPKDHIPVHIMTSNEPSDTRPSVMISIVCLVSSKRNECWCTLKLEFIRCGKGGKSESLDRC